jgi:8-oxo-dGTP pyrophosphatase MutT (NUDIX family)
MDTTNRIKSLIYQSWASTAHIELSQKVCGIKLDFQSWNAVSLFLFVEDEIFFIRRSDSMPTFKGHLAFIGGHKHAEDKSVWDTAKREFEEETGLCSKSLEFMGYMPVVSTVSNRFIAPVVAKTTLSKKEFINSVKTNGEWVYAFTTSFHSLLVEDMWGYGIGHWEGLKRHILFHNIGPSLQNSTRAQVTDELLWGATAKMVWSMVQLYKS